MFAPNKTSLLLLLLLIGLCNTSNITRDSRRGRANDVFFVHSCLDMRFGLNIFYSGIKYTDKDRARHKVRHNPLQMSFDAIINKTVCLQNTNASYKYKRYDIYTF